MICQHCGTQNEVTAQVCAKCGQPLKLKKFPNWIVPVALSSLLVLSSSALVIGYVNDWDYGKLFKHSGQNATSPSKTAEVDKPDVVQPLSKETESSSQDESQMIQEALPRVFTIFTQERHGSGFLYTSGGMILTNAHVVSGYIDVVVRNSAGEDVSGKVIGISDRYDIALIHAPAYDEVEPFLIESEASQVGTEVIALGTPQTFENFASFGYLKEPNPNVEMVFVDKNIYQIDAHLDRGSSGGPLLDADTGKVIGVNSLLYLNNARFGYTIPMYRVQSLVNQWVDSPMSATEVASTFVSYESTAANSPSDNEWLYEDDYNAFYQEGELDAEFENEYGVDPYPVNGQFDEDSLAAFLLLFREEYELSVQAGEYIFLMDFLQPDSSSTSALLSFFEQRTADDSDYEFHSSDVKDVHIKSDHAFVTLDLSYSITTNIGEVKDVKETTMYTVIIDDGYYQISEITDVQ